MDVRLGFTQSSRRTQRALIGKGRWELAGECRQWKTVYAVVRAGQVGANVD
jgi:hypothetical protein